MARQMFRRIRNAGCALLLLLWGGQAHAQTQMLVSKVDSAGLIVYTAAHYGYFLTLGDLKKESANLMGVGMDLGLKTLSNWSFNAGFTYCFSGNVKGTDSLFRMITNSNGSIMDGDGQPADIDVDQRLWCLRAEAGKIFPISRNYRNSSIQLKLGAGVEQRYVYIKNPENRVAALTNEYKKGYDRLSIGCMLYQFVGYTHISKTKYTCFYIGVEVMEGFTHRQRDWDFSLMAKDERSFTDIMAGVKAGWIIPFYKKEYQDTYYFR